MSTVGHGKKKKILIHNLSSTDAGFGQVTTRLHNQSWVQKRYGILFRRNLHQAHGWGIGSWYWAECGCQLFAYTGAPGGSATLGDPVQIREEHTPCEKHQGIAPKNLNIMLARESARHCIRINKEGIAYPEWWTERTSQVICTACGKDREQCLKESNNGMFFSCPNINPNCG